MYICVRSHDFSALAGEHQKALSRTDTSILSAPSLTSEVKITKIARVLIGIVGLQSQALTRREIVPSNNNGGCDIPKAALLHQAYLLKRCKV